MNARVALARLERLGAPAFTTADARAAFGGTIAAASPMLASLAKEGLAVPLRRGLWTLDPELDPLLLPEHSSAPSPSYVSLQTSLYRHGPSNRSRASSTRSPSARRSATRPREGPSLCIESPGALRRLRDHAGGGQARERREGARGSGVYQRGEEPAVRRVAAVGAALELRPARGEGVDRADPIASAPDARRALGREVGDARVASRRLRPADIRRSGQDWVQGLAVLSESDPPWVWV